MAEAQIFITLMFAMTGLRASLPGVPPIGMGIDFFGFIWVRSILILYIRGVSCRSQILPGESIWNIGCGKISCLPQVIICTEHLVEQESGWGVNT